MKLTLETERLILRPYRMDDDEAMFYGWANDPEVTKYLTWSPHTDIETTRRILGVWISEYEQPERLNFAIELKDGGELIGGIDVCGYRDGVPVIGYVLGKKHWNRGYMTEACRRVLELLFERGFKEVSIDAAAENVGSNKVIEKCGGVYQKTEECEFPLKNVRMPVNKYIVYAG